MFSIFLVKSEMLIPWLLFYALFIPGLICAGVVNAIFQEDFYFQIYSGIPIFVGFVYMLLWISVFRLYKTGVVTKNVILRGLGDIFLEPLTSKVTAYVEETQGGGIPSKDAWDRRQNLYTQWVIEIHIILKWVHGVSFLYYELYYVLILMKSVFEIQYENNQYWK